MVQTDLWGGERLHAEAEDRRDNAGRRSDPVSGNVLLQIISGRSPYDSHGDDLSHIAGKKEEDKGAGEAAE